MGVSGSPTRPLWNKSMGVFPPPERTLPQSLRRLHSHQSPLQSPQPSPYVASRQSTPRATASSVEFKLSWTSDEDVFGGSAALDRRPSSRRRWLQRSRDLSSDGAADQFTGDYDCGKTSSVLAAYLLERAFTIHSLLHERVTVDFFGTTADCTVGKGTLQQSALQG